MMIDGSSVTRETLLSHKLTQQSHASFQKLQFRYMKVMIPFFLLLFTMYNPTILGCLVAHGLASSLCIYRINRVERQWRNWLPSTTFCLSLYSSSHLDVSRMFHLSQCRILLHPHSRRRSSSQRSSSCWIRFAFHCKKPGTAKSTLSE